MRVCQNVEVIGSYRKLCGLCRMKLTDNSLNVKVKSFVR